MRRKFAAQVKKKYLLHFNCVNYVRAYFGGFAPCGLSTLLDFGARGSKSTTGQKVSWLKSKIDFDRILHVGASVVLLAPTIFYREYPWKTPFPSVFQTLCNFVK